MLVDRRALVTPKRTLVQTTDLVRGAVTPARAPAHRLARLTWKSVGVRQRDMIGNGLRRSRCVAAAVVAAIDRGITDAGDAPAEGGDQVL